MLEIIETSDRFQLRMSATLENIEQADDRLTAYLEARDVPVDMFAVRIVLREALANAVIHGASKDPDQTVHLALTVGPRYLSLTVSDPGPGFAWSDRRTEFDVVGDGGRGLPLMDIYADETVFNAKGNRISLRIGFRAVSAPCGGRTRSGNEETP